MKRTSIALAAVFALSLAGCGTMGSVTPPPSNIAGTIAQIQATARQICSFVPTANTVASLLAAFGVPGISGITSIASEICNAVVNNPMTEGPRGGRTVPRVGGVAIKGKFVR